MTEPMPDVSGNFKAIADSIANTARACGRAEGSVRLVAVTKTHDAPRILPVLEAGHKLFGENRVQEAQAKWPSLKDRFAGLTLHLIGPLQSNKARDAVRLFDVIETVDRPKIAEALAAEMKRQARRLPCFIQVNIGREPQKAGIAPEAADDFVRHCRDTLDLDVRGLMCIPPADVAPEPHFELLRAIALRNNLSELSMGMSSDYPAAIRCGATLVRVGTAIFGAR